MMVSETLCLTSEIDILKTALAEKDDRIAALESQGAEKDDRISTLEETILGKDIKIVALENENSILKGGVESDSADADTQNTPKKHSRQASDNSSDTLYVKALKRTISGLQKNLKNEEEAKEDQQLKHAPQYG